MMETYLTKCLEGVALNSKCLFALCIYKLILFKANFKNGKPVKSGCVIIENQH